MEFPDLGKHAPTSGAALQHAEYTDAPAEAVNAVEANSQAEHAVLLAQAPEANSGSTTPSATNQAQLIAHKTTPLRAPSNAALDCAITITDDPEEWLRTVAWMQLVALLIHLHIIDPSTTLASITAEASKIGVPLEQYGVLRPASIIPNFQPSFRGGFRGGGGFRDVLSAGSAGTSWPHARRPASAGSTPSSAPFYPPPLSPFPHSPNFMNWGSRCSCD